MRAGSAAEALDVTLPQQDVDQRRVFSITATFEIKSPLLIRSEAALENGAQPDVAHLHNSQHQPIVSGTSLAGVLRARAVRIVNTIGASIDLNSLFGRDMHREKGDPSRSRLIVRESAIEGGTTLVQNRVAIDRFTGGALDTALFAEAPQVGGDVELRLIIRDPNSKEKGLLLLLLKDLWTGDLPLGGTSSIGRGRLRGLRAEIADEGQVWQMHKQDGGIELDDAARVSFEHYVDALNGQQGATQ